MKKKIKEDVSNFSEDSYKGVNTVFTKSIHKIIFDIQNKPYFEWLIKLRICILNTINKAQLALD